METKNSIINRALAAEIKGERVAVGMSIKQLADASGVPTGTLNRMSSDDIRDINVTQMAAIAAAFNLSTAELVARAETRAARMASAMSEAPRDNVTQLHIRDMTPEQLDNYQGERAAHAFDEEADRPEQ